MVRNLLILCLVGQSLSCAKRSIDQGELSNTKNQLVLGPQRIDVAGATAEQCSAGGSVYTVYYDQNENGLLEPTDLVANSQVICNGAHGANGHSTLMDTSRVTVGLASCASGSGLQINIGLDINDNLVLDNSEITSPALICDGENGAVGQAGPSGSDGYSTVFAKSEPSIEECPAGGATIVMALDVDRSGTLSGLDQNIESATLCNGQVGATPAYTPVEPIMACGNSVAYKEVLLRLSGGQVLGSFSETVSGSMTRLAFLPDGNYMNTDSSGCTFSLSTSGDGQTRSISWFGQVQASWPLLF